MFASLVTGKYRVFLHSYNGGSGQHGISLVGIIVIKRPFSKEKAKCPSNAADMRKRKGEAVFKVAKYSRVWSLAQNIYKKLKPAV